MRSKQESMVSPPVVDHPGKSSRWFRRREVWVPTLRSFALAGFLVLVLMGAFVFGVHPFLAPTRPASDPELLVIEGWMPDYNLPRVIADFREGPFDKVAATGIALDRGSYLVDFESFGEVAAASLKKLGLSDEEVLVAATTQTRRHRTYTAAVALKEAIDANQMRVKSFTVYSQTVHARRTWIIFRKVFGEDVEVGIVALPHEEYDNDRWWGSSAGIKIVGMELLAFLYEWLLDSGR